MVKETTQAQDALLQAAKSALNVIRQHSATGESDIELTLAAAIDGVRREAKLSGERRAAEVTIKESEKAKFFARLDDLLEHAADWKAVIRERSADDWANGCERFPGNAFGTFRATEAIVRIVIRRE